VTATPGNASIYGKKEYEPHPVSRLIPSLEPTPLDPCDSTSTIREDIMTLRVLIVGDDSQLHELVSRALQLITSFVFVVERARSYSAAADALREDKHDLLLLDHDLGGRTSIELLQEVFGARIPLPVVLFTGAATREIDAAAARAGITHLLEKASFTPGALERTMRCSIDRVSTKREMERARAIFRAGFNALREHVAILDETGTIVEVNDAWRRFPLGNESPDPMAGLGHNYLDLCIAATGVRATEAAAVSRGIRELLAGERSSFSLTFPIQHGGEERWFVLRAFRFENGGRVLAHVSLQDVTETHRTEDALRASEARYRGLVETAHVGVWAVNGTGLTTYVNPRMAVMLGYAPGEMHDRLLFDFMDAESAFQARTLFARRQRGLSDTHEVSFLRKDGTLVPTLVSASPQTVGDEFVGALAMVTDITDRKRGEAELTSALAAADLDRRRLQATLDALPVGVWLADAEGRITHTNPATARIWGGQAPRVQHTGEYEVYRAWSPHTGEPVATQDRALVRVLSTGESAESGTLEIGRFDGSRGFVINSAVPIRDGDGHLTGVVVVNVDITERQAEAREREHLLRELEFERARLTAVFEQTPAFMAVLRGPDYVYERLNPAYQRVLGDRPVLGKARFEAVPELRDQGSFEQLEHVRKTGEVFVGREIPVRLARNPGGALETRYLNLVYQPLLEQDGSSSAIIAHGVDVTEQVIAGKALAESERQMREMFAKLPVPTMLWEALDEDDFILVAFNEAAAPILTGGGVDPIGRRGSELFPQGVDVAADCWRSLREGIVVEREVAYDAGPQAGQRTFLLTIGPQSSRRVLLHAVDTTEKRQLELQLRQGQKMEAVGHLAGGIAHDFNNLLTVVAAHSSFLLESLDVRDSRRDDAEAIQEAGRRAAGLTRQLLAFSRKQILRPSILDLNQTVDEAYRMLRRLIGEDIEIVVELTPEIGFVHADTGQMEQVLLNLAVNARDAMPSGGRLSLATSVMELADGPATVRLGMTPGSYVVLTVRDTGIGMDEHTQARVFEPFFTTKEPGRGTGLGLATVYGIVKQSNGHIRLESEPGRGTSFTIYLPLVTVAGVVEESRAAAPAPVMGTETILLVEDDAALRNLAARVLRAQGYLVLDARDGKEALELEASHGSAIDLVLSDTVLPGMNGVEVVRRLAERRPGLKSVYMSGYTDDEVLRRGIVTSEVRFVQKPFTPNVLAQTVRDALDA
jgi:two-component system cell cycle sensor histidine kinase/response regulator CckA